MATKSTHTIVITGTHHTPALELLKQLKQDSKHNWRIHYISDQYPTETHLANSVIPLVGKNFHQLNCGKYNRHQLFKTLLGIPKTFKATFSAFQLLSIINPNIIVSFGGYVSVPLILAASFKGIPTITHEQTPTISLSTRLNYFFGAHLALSFPNPSYPHAIVTGNLLRSEIYNTNPDIFKNLKLNINKYPLIYIAGGNQGSLFLNTLTTQIVPELVKHYSIIHHTGISKNTNTTFSHQNYITKDYINSNEIGPVLNHASLLISRSGANICQEIVALSRKAILIPLPFSQQNEQQLNAQWVHQQLPKTTIIIPQDQATPVNIFTSINKLANIPLLSPKRTPLVNYEILHLIHQLV